MTLVALVCHLAVALVFLGKGASLPILTENDIADIDRYVEKIIKCRNIPGLALAIVHKDKIIHTKGYGYADIEKGQKVTEGTRFCIGSLTKAFTSTLLAMLLGEKEGFDWDTKIRDILGNSFHLSDDLRTRETNIRDLLAHKLGVPSYFTPLLTGYPTDTTRADIVQRLRFMEPTEEFRTKFQYNNYMYGLAGYVAEKLDGTGKTWEELVDERIFKPLGMDTAFYVDGAGDLQRFAMPYVTVNGTIKRISEKTTRVVHPLGPAGSIAASSHDMAKWIRFHLMDGTDVDNNTLVDKKYIRETYKGQMPEPSIHRDKTRPMHPISDVSLSYDMAWMTALYRGYKKIWHSGGISSYASNLWMFPELGIGIYANYNGPTSKSAKGLEAILYYVTDIVLGLEKWLNETTGCTYPKNIKQGERDKKSGPKKPTEPAKPAYVYNNETGRDLREFVGVYGHFAFGNISVFMNTTSGILQMKFGMLGEGDLVPIGPDIFNVTWTGDLWYLHSSDMKFTSQKFTFNSSIDSDGGIDLLYTRMDPKVEVPFKRDLKFADAPRANYKGYCISAAPSLSLVYLVCLVPIFMCSVLCG